MSDRDPADSLDELLKALGPNWSAMSPAERLAYGSPASERPNLTLAYPALALWWGELHNGYRGQRADVSSTWVKDALWRAACAEYKAMEYERDGLKETARRCRERADEALVEAARLKKGRAA